MSNDHFNFKRFTIYQDRSAFKVGTDGVLLGAAVEIKGAKRILDIGSGTGLIAIMLAQRSDADIVAIEPDHDSFLQTCDNTDRCPWNSRIKVENTKLQDFRPASTKFDLIVSNPPFFSDSLKNPDPRRSSARHNDSLTSEDLLEGVLRLMNEGGFLEVIMPYAEGNVFIAEAQAFGLYCNSILKIRPLPTSEIRRLILRFSKRQIKVSEKILTIEQGKRYEFTEEYKNLTRDFYLKF
jgi:tRNA1Val (adenine37-N6)-methyltransferase